VLADRAHGDSALPDGVVAPFAISIDRSGGHWSVSVVASYGDIASSDTGMAATGDGVINFRS
jgi:hypothetical protein